MIEADEGYFEIQAQNDSGAQKSERGSNTKSNVMVMAESTVLEDIKTGETSRQCRYFKAKVLSGHEAGEADGAIKNAIDGEKSIVFSDRSTSYVNIEDYVDIHISEKSNEKTTKETLKWVNMAIMAESTTLKYIETYALFQDEGAGEPQKGWGKPSVLQQFWMEKVSYSAIRAQVMWILRTT